MGRKKYSTGMTPDTRKKLEKYYANNDKSTKGRTGNTSTGVRASE